MKNLSQIKQDAETYKTEIRKQNPNKGRIQANIYTKHLPFEPRYEKTCLLHMQKTKAQISCALTAADQHLCFHYIVSTIPLLPKSEIPTLWSSSVAVQPGLGRTWSENPKTGFLATWFIFIHSADPGQHPITVTRLFVF